MIAIHLLLSFVPVYDADQSLKERHLLLGMWVSHSGTPEAAHDERDSIYHFILKFRKVKSFSFTFSLPIPLR